MIKLSKITNNQTKQVDIFIGTDLEYANQAGFTENDCVQDWRGNWYLSGYAPQQPALTVQEQIEALERTITARNYRSALTGDEYALQKIKDVESKISVLRQQLAVTDEQETKNTPLDDY